MRFSIDNGAMLESDQELIDAFLDYKNDFLSVHAFASHYGLSPEHAVHVIDEGRELLNGERNEP